MGRFNKNDVGLEVMATRDVPVNKDTGYTLTPGEIFVIDHQVIDKDMMYIKNRSGDSYLVYQSPFETISELRNRKLKSLLL
jgi:hypothetical protein